MSNRVQRIKSLSFDALAALMWDESADAIERQLAMNEYDHRLWELNRLRPLGDPPTVSGDSIAYVNAYNHFGFTGLDHPLK